MEHPRIDEMSTEDFDKVIDAYIERETQDTGELTAPIFYETLENIFAEPELPTVVELEAEVIGSNIQFAFPKSEVAGVEIQGNEIIINNLRFVIHLAPAQAA